MTKVTNSLDEYQLEYEEMEMHKVPKVKSNVAKPKAAAKVVKTDAVKRKEEPSLKTRFVNNLKMRGTESRAAFYELKAKLTPKKKPSKLSKKAQMERKKTNRAQQKRGIIGIGLLFVVVSIAYSTYVIYNGVHSTASRVMLIPQVVFAVLTLVKAFSKIYK